MNMHRIKFKDKINNLAKKPNFGLIVVFIIIFLFLSLAAKNFASFDNVLIMLNQASFIAIIAISMTLVISMAGIDLSVGSMVSITGIIIGNLLLSGFNVYLAIVITFASGFMIGMVNGILIAKVKIPDFIVTLAMLTILQGIIRVWTGGMSVYGLKSPEFAWLGQGKVFGVSTPFIITIIITILFYFLTYKTTFGRYVVSIGSNKEAARLVGIHISKIKILVYSISGLLSALVGILIASRVSTAMIDAGSGYEMNVIAATVIGGTSLSGGKAQVIGAVIGALLMTMIVNGLNILNVDTALHQVVIGIIILLAVGIDEYSSKKSKTA